MNWEPPEASRSRWPKPCKTSAVRARGVRQGDRAFRGGASRLVPAAGAADPRPSGSTLGAAVLLEDVTRFRLLDEVKSNMVATVSHELKTPLTSIRLVIHLLLEENVGPLAAQAARTAGRCPRQRRAAAGHDQQPARPGPAGTGGLATPLRAGAAHALLQPAADAFRPRTKDRGVELVVDDPGNVEAIPVDKEQFQHALQNLLDNALAHTPRAARSRSAAEAVDGSVAIAVSDTGSGIPPEYIPLIFEQYFRVPGDTTPGGSGLGLAIVREIVASHGGTVDCQSCRASGPCSACSFPHAIRPVGGRGGRGA